MNPAIPTTTHYLDALGDLGLSITDLDSVGIEDTNTTARTIPVQVGRTFSFEGAVSKDETVPVRMVVNSAKLSRITRRYRDRTNRGGPGYHTVTMMLRNVSAEMFVGLAVNGRTEMVPLDEYLRHVEFAGRPAERWASSEDWGPWLARKGFDLSDGTHTANLQHMRSTEAGWNKLRDLFVANGGTQVHRARQGSTITDEFEMDRDSGLDVVSFEMVQQDPLQSSIGTQAMEIFLANKVPFDQAEQLAWQYGEGWRDPFYAITSNYSRVVGWSKSAVLLRKRLIARKQEFGQVADGLSAKDRAEFEKELTLTQRHIEEIERKARSWSRSLTGASPRVLREGGVAVVNAKPNDPTGLDISYDPDLVDPGQMPCGRISVVNNADEVVHIDLWDQPNAAIPTVSETTTVESPATTEEVVGSVDDLLIEE